MRCQLVPERGDNFELVYDGHAWHGEAPPQRLMALILIAMRIERKGQEQA